jgi:hypothetical protein
VSGAHPQTPTQRAHPMVPDPATPWSPTRIPHPATPRWCTTGCALRGAPCTAAYHRCVLLRRRPTLASCLAQRPGSCHRRPGLRGERGFQLTAERRQHLCTASGIRIDYQAPPCETSPEASRRRRGGSSSADHPTIRPYLLQEHKLCLGHGLEEERSIGSPEKLCP